MPDLPPSLPHILCLRPYFTCPCPPAPALCSNLKRYLHYLTRYEANLQSKKMEEKLRQVGACCC